MQIDAWLDRTTQRHCGGAVTLTACPTLTETPRHAIGDQPTTGLQAIAKTNHHKITHHHHHQRRHRDLVQPAITRALPIEQQQTSGFQPPHRPTDDQIPSRDNATPSPLLLLNTAVMSQRQLARDMQTEFQARVRIPPPLFPPFLRRRKRGGEISGLTWSDTTQQFSAKQARREAMKAQKADNDAKKQITNVRSPPPPEHTHLPPRGGGVGGFEHILRDGKRLTWVVENI